MLKSLFKKIVVHIITFQAKYLLKKWNPYIIAVTGNLGKTSTKDVIFASLKDNLLDENGETLVLASKKSMNSDTGVPLTILELDSGYGNIFHWMKIVFSGFNKMLTPKYYKYLILEVGADMPLDIKNVAKYIKPDLVVLTAFAEVPVHIENFGGDRERLIREKKYLVEAIKSQGTLIYDAGDKDSEKIAKEISEKHNIFLKTFTTNKKLVADIKTESIDFLEDKKIKDNMILGMRSILSSNDLEISEILKDKELAIYGSIGESVIISALPALLIVNMLGVNLSKVLLDISKMKRPNGRMRILDGVYGSIIIDDTYNSSPKAAKNGVEAIKKIKIKAHQKKILILGDMLELGEYTREEHLKLGRLAAEVADILITVGIRARIIAEGALDSGMKDENIFMCDNSLLAGRDLMRILENLEEEKFKRGLNESQAKKEKNIIYFKASQGIRLEKAVKMILAENHDSNIDLVRQDNFWKSKN